MPPLFCTFLFWSVIPWAKLDYIVYQEFVMLTSKMKAYILLFSAGFNPYINLIMWQRLMHAIPIMSHVLYWFLSWRTIKHLSVIFVWYFLRKWLVNYMLKTSVCTSVNLIIRCLLDIRFICMLSYFKGFAICKNVLCNKRPLICQNNFRVYIKLQMLIVCIFTFFMNVYVGVRV